MRLGRGLLSWLRSRASRAQDPPEGDGSVEAFDQLIAEDLARLGAAGEDGVAEFAPGLHGVARSGGGHPGESKVPIPMRFRRVVELHLLRNLQADPPAGTPLILGIHGPSGEGKTFQTEQLLAEHDVHAVLVSGGQLESGTAGEPAAIVRESYLEAGTAVANGGYAAVLLNDADAAIGSWGAMTQYTINTQNVITELMHLCDYPTSIEGKVTPRIPVFITGNDFTRLYAPLCRHGRMELFEWSPSFKERQAILGSYFPTLRPSELEELLVEYSSQPVAFWGSVRLSLDDARLLASASGKSLRAAVDDLATERGSRSPSVSLALVQAAAKSISEQVPLTYLEEH